MSKCYVLLRADTSGNMAKNDEKEKYLTEVIHMDDKIQIFEDKRIRTAWNEETEEWYFSVVDVVSVLTDSVDGRKYWNKLKQRLKEENESY